MKKISIVSSVIVLSFLVAGGFTMADRLSPKMDDSDSVKPIIKDIKNSELRQQLNISEIRGRMICREVGNCSSTTTDKSAIEILMKASKVTEIGDNYLKVSVFQYAYKIDISAANIVRHTWGPSNISEFSVGDIINVWGYLDETDTSLVHAKTIRNVSVQKIYGVFRGIIASIDSANNTFVLKTGEKGNQTVVVSSDTKIINGTTTASFADLQVGMGAVVRGVWDRTLSRIKAQTINIPGKKEFRPFLKDDFLKELKSKLENED